MPALLQLCEQWLIARIHFDADLRAKLETCIEETHDRGRTPENPAVESYMQKQMHGLFGAPIYFPQSWQVQGRGEVRHVLNTLRSMILVRRGSFVSWGDDKVSINGDSQAIREQEHAYAAQAGLNYWGFCPA